MVPSPYKCDLKIFSQWPCFLWKISLRLFSYAIINLRLRYDYQNFFEDLSLQMILIRKNITFFPDFNLIRKFLLISIVFSIFPATWYDCNSNEFWWKLLLLYHLISHLAVLRDSFWTVLHFYLFSLFILNTVKKDYLLFYYYKSILWFN